MTITNLIKPFMEGVDWECEIYDDNDFSILLLIDSSSDEDETDVAKNVELMIVKLVNKLNKISGAISDNYHKYILEEIKKTNGINS
jgi:hypothetical protein